MPPKQKRQTPSAPRASSSAPDLPQRPRLPALRGAPSARRQYTYGAAIEPEPNRGEVEDNEDPATLDHAIGYALNRQGREGSTEVVNVARARPARTAATAVVEEPTPAAKPVSRLRTRKARKSPDEDEDDELAAPAYPTQRGTSATPSDGDGSRSFGVESSINGNASLASNASSQPGADNERMQQPASSRSSTPTRRRTRAAAKDPTFRDEGAESDGSDDESLNARPASRGRPSRLRSQLPQPDDQQAMPPPPLPKKPATPFKKASAKAEAIRSAEDKVSQAAAQRAEREREAREQEELEREEREAAERTREAARTANEAQRIALKESKRAAAEVEAAARVRRAALNSPRGAFDRAANRAADNQLQLQQLEGEIASKAAQIREEQDDASDYSEQDAAMQNEISARAEALAYQLRRDAWKRQLSSMWPTKFIRQHFRSLNGDDEATRSGWRRIFGLKMYSDALSDVWSIILTLCKSVTRLLPSLAGLLTFTFAVTAFALIWPYVRTDTSYGGDFVSPYSTSTWLQYPTNVLKDVSGALSSVVPIITSPFRTNWDNVFDLADFERNDHGKIEIDKFLEKYGKQFDAFKQAGLLHSQAIAKLEKIVPKIVHMKLDHGKPIVAEEFWHALRELIEADERILTMQKNGQLSEGQWKAVSSRLLQDPGFNSKLEDNISGVEKRTQQRMSGLWDTWVANNEGKLQTLLGDSVEKLRTVGTGKEFEERLNRIVQQQLQDGKLLEGVVVTRDEFIRHLRNEFATHRAEINAEFRELQPQMRDFIVEYLDTHNVGRPNSSTDSISRTEVDTMIKTAVTNAVSQALSNAQLQGLTNGKIKAHWDAELKNKINYFNIGSGATIHGSITSPTYDPFKQGHIDREELQNGLRGARRWAPTEALSRWDDDGDKWCGARVANKDGVANGYRLGVQISQQVIPQHIVVEHILPGATIDPKSRPRDIEIYADIEDAAVRDRLLDFSATHFPEDSTTPSADLPASMVLIGRFTYTGAELHDGVYVHRLSDALIQLQAETSFIVIRAVNNYGSDDHTCFYRVRMYGIGTGTPLNIEESPREKPSTWKSWWFLA